ncbi:RING-H2 finger protein ATL40-like [Tripterygium wilfordii]|uniref:RING-H2 finger protein ATL40-like n=1 Tax=Tripterygium wilfordii TaxID=458696 RepID=UPI0018F81283|nr:RING-H2 finger protein ATL40-like [Tripterygium wilfordii]
MSSDDDDQSSSSSFSPSRRILIISIISLLVITILIVMLHLYSRYLRRRQLREIRQRRNTLNRLISAQIAPDVPNYRDDDPPKIGLNPSVIASLPRLPYKSTSDQNSESIVECSVCLGNIIDETPVRLLPNCKHMFHVECIDVWLASNTTCPVCRTTAEPMKVQPEENKLGPDKAQPSAPPMDQNGSGSRISSFRRMLSRDRSRVQSRGDDVCVEDLERQ